MSAIAFALIWFACAVGFVGTVVAYFQGEFPNGKDYRENLGFGVLFGFIGGPIALVVGACASGFWKHGWRLTP